MQSLLSSQVVQGWAQMCRFLILPCDNLWERGAGCVWTTYLANGEMDMFPKDLGGDRDIERLQLLR